MTPAGATSERSEAQPSARAATAPDPSPPQRLAAAQRSASAALKNSQARLRAAEQLTGLASWTLAVATGRLEWSEQMFHLVGLDPADDAPDLESFFARVHPEDRDRCRAIWGGDQPPDVCGREIFRVVHLDGTLRYLQAWSQLDQGDDEHPATVSGATLDVTDRERAARDLAASEQHFRIAFDNAPIGMSLISLRPENVGCYLRANDAFALMLGYRPDEITSMDVSELTHPGDIARDLARFESIVHGDATSVEFEKRYCHKDGHVVFAWLSSAVAVDPSGAPLYLISHAVDVTDRRKEQAELQRLALTDTLTGLANRTLLRDRVDQALARLHREESFAALLQLDIDRFKAVNDSLGHGVGDALLVEMAARIEAVSRADSTVARVGGDEFVVLVEGLASPDDVHGVATRLLEAMRRPYSIPGTGETLVATVSIGVAVITSADRSPLDLHREADLAMYRAKDAGRDQYALFDDALRARVVARTDAESLLKRALAEDLLAPHYQPILDMSAGRLVSVEALARIHDPVRGVITPDQFLDVAEETGLIVEVDGRMIERAIGQLARWRKAGVQLRGMSVNVSARSLEDPEFVERVGKAAKWYDVAGAELRIELTERSVLTTSPVVRASIDRLAELGFDVGLDNFGTGYSALAYLQRFPLAFLKIDRSFIRLLGHSRRDDAVVAAVIDLAHAHDALVVGQGVETLDQLATLRAMGCDRAQGDLLGRALPPDELEAIIVTDPRW